MLNREISWVIFDPLNNLIDVKTINGMVMTDNKLIMAVRDIERATSPLANEVKRFEVTPPGAAAIIITPIASSGEIDHVLTRRNATIGRTTICETAPTKKSRGCFITLKKSAPVKPRPRANIIKAKAKGKITSVTIFIYVIIKIYEKNNITIFYNKHMFV